MISRKQLDDFYQFALQHMVEQNAELSLDDLYLTWRAQQPKPDELQQSVEASRAAYAGHEQGDQGEPAREHLRASCVELGLAIDE